MRPNEEPTTIAPSVVTATEWPDAPVSMMRTEPCGHHQTRTVRSLLPLTTTARPPSSATVTARTAPA